jgi:hypothetical protein
MALYLIHFLRSHETGALLKLIEIDPFMQNLSFGRVTNILHLALGKQVQKDQDEIVAVRNTLQEQV